jgi:hypothetical protein
MTISSSLGSFSLPELFCLIEEGNKSGRLIVQPSLAKKEKHLKSIYYVWFQDGYLVAISDRLNCRSLIEFIENRGWLSTLITNKLRILCPPEMPMGVYLYKNKLLTKEKLSLIFQIQLHQVYELFQLNSGLFRFDELSELKTRLLTIPWLEMTGHRMRATQVSIYGLRLINNWENFDEYLPEPNFALQRLSDRPRLKLMPLESQVWQLATGQISLQQIAEKTGKHIKLIQITAFCLMLVGLVDEVFLANQNYGVGE